KVTLAPTVAIWVYVPVVPSFRSIMKPCSLSALSVQANWSSPALDWLCQCRVAKKKKVRIHSRRFRLRLTLTPQAAAYHETYLSCFEGQYSGILLKVKRTVCIKMPQDEDHKVSKAIVNASANIERVRLDARLQQGDGVEELQCRSLATAFHGRLQHHMRFSRCCSGADRSYPPAPPNLVKLRSA